MEVLPSNCFSCLIALFFVCAVVSCGPPVDSVCKNSRKPANGTVKCSCDWPSDALVAGGKSSGGSSSKGDDGAFACTYSCNKGYQLNGPSVVECPLKIGDNPTCEPIQCARLPAVDHGSLNCSNGFTFPSVCQFSCAPGFNISGGNNLVSCGPDGLWKGIVPMCTPVQCLPLSEPKHGSLSCPNGRTFASDCRYRCDDRYILDGSAVATCSASGLWSYTKTSGPPTCKLGQCPPLPLLVHGSLTCTKGWDIGSVCSYSCHKDFSLTGGTFLHICRYNGYWRGDLPTCERANLTVRTEFAVYDVVDVGDGGQGFSGGMPSNIIDSGGASGKNADKLTTPTVVAIVFISLILVVVVAGLFLARRVQRKSNSAEYGRLMS